jgi:hypothetical protein
VIDDEDSAVALAARPGEASERRARLLLVIGAALSIAVVMVAYWPGLRGFWGRDDYFVLAYMRLVDNPWAFFVNDHFPVQGSIFRPLGFASMWLTQALFGTAYRAESLADLGLHIAVAVALFRVVSLVLRTPLLALSCTLLFAVQPAALATVLVWTNRFDLLAAFFCLLALRAAYDYRAGGGPIHLAATLIFALAAMAARGCAARAVFREMALRAARAPRDGCRVFPVALARARNAGEPSGRRRLARPLDR